MITISLTLLFKIIALICSGTIIIASIAGTLKTKDMNFIGILIIFLFVVTPFIYIILN